MLATSTLRIGRSRLGVLCAIAMIAALGSHNTTANAGVPDDLIAYWHFNNIHPTTFMRYDFGGQMRLRGAGGSGTPIQFEFSMSGHEGLVISFAQRKFLSDCLEPGTCTNSFNSGTWWWATGDDPESFTQLPDVDTLAEASGKWEVQTADFSDVLDLNDAETVIIRYVLSEPLSTPNLYLDNIQIRANEVGGEPDALLAYWHFYEFDTSCGQPSSGHYNLCDPVIEADVGSGHLNTSPWGGDVWMLNGEAAIHNALDDIPFHPDAIVTHPADVGSAQIDFSGWHVSANTLTGFGAGTPNLNALFGEPVGERLRLTPFSPIYGPEENFTRDLDFKFSMTNRENLTIGLMWRSHTQSSGSSFDTYAWSWSTDGVNFTEVLAGGVHQDQNIHGYASAFFDFGSIGDLAGADEVTLRLTLSGSTGALNTLIDNIQIRADPIPVADCGADFDCNGVVNVFDLLELLAAWGPCPGSPGECAGNCGGGTLDCSCDADCALFADCCPGVCFDCPSLGFCADCGDGTPAAYCPEPCPADLDNNTVVNVFDLLELLANWGPVE